jgi:hypothetical protein
MTREQVESAMGERPEIRKSRVPSEESWSFPRSNARVSMRDGVLVEASVAPPSRVWVDGQSLFESSNLWRELFAADEDAREVVGFLVLKGSGLALTGFHDEDTTQLAVTAFEPGRWDKVSKDGERYSA